MLFLAPVGPFLFGDLGETEIRNEQHTWVWFLGFGGAYWTVVQELGDEVDEKPAVGSGQQQSNAALSPGGLLNYSLGGWG